MQLEPFRMHFVLRLPFGRLVKNSKPASQIPKQFASLLSLSIYVYRLVSIYNRYNEDKYFGNETTRLVKYISSLLSLNRMLYKVEKESISSAIKFYLSIRLLGWGFFLYDDLLRHDSLKFLHNFWLRFLFLSVLFSSEVVSKKVYEMFDGLYFWSI